VRAALLHLLITACLASAAHAQRSPAQARADTFEPDSTFRRAGVVLRWQVVSRELIERRLATRGERATQATFYDGNNNSRLYALVAGAQFDALRQVSPPDDADAAAAAAAAAVLRVVFPGERALIDRELATERDRLRAGGVPLAAVRSGEALGRRAATRWLTDARAELRVAPWTGHAPGGPATWRGQGDAPALAISLGLRPWFLARRDQFRPPPPPAPGSAELAAGLAAVRTATAHRTRPQTRATWAWARNAATLWSEIAGEVIVRRGLSQPEAARALMYLNMALSDATIACWDAKLTYWSPRPSQLDSALDLSIPLPDFPSYPSAHATLFATGAAVLGHMVPAEQAMLDSLARDATDSRVWAGVHFPFDNDAGTLLGRHVADAAIAVLEAEPR
jgi:hypothetical protein